MCVCLCVFVYVCAHTHVLAQSCVCMHADFKISFQAVSSVILHGLGLELCVKVTLATLMLAQSVSKTQAAGDNRDNRVFLHKLLGWR